MSVIGWELARDWLHAAGLPPSSSLIDLASVLQDGVALCELLNRVSPNCIPTIHQKTSLQVGV